MPMGKIFAGLAVTLTAMPLAAAVLPTPILVGDFSPGRTDNESPPLAMAAIGDRLYFSGSDQQHGAEPWVSDGTAAGTRMLADLCPGTCGSFPESFTAVGDRVVFATKPYSGHEDSVYAIAGGQVEEIGPGLAFASGFVRLGPIVYFSAYSGLTYQMHRTDGTAAGTFATSDFCFDAVPCANAGDRAARGGKIFFTETGDFYALRAERESERLASLVSYHEPVELDESRIVFRGCTGGYELGCWAWVSDGTAFGTRRLAAGSDDPLAADPRGLVAWRGRVYFVNDAGQLASTDGRPGSTRVESFAGAGPSPFAANEQSLLYLTRAAGVSGFTLRARRADGGDFLLAGGASRIELHGDSPRLGEKIFIMADGRLMATDGTPGGTAVLAGGGSPSFGATLEDFYYFGLERHGEVPGGLWRSDGSAAGTSRLDLGLDDANGTAITPYALASSLVAEIASPTAAAGAGLYLIDPLTFAATPADPRPLKVLAAGKTVLYASGSEAGRRPLAALRDGAVSDLRADADIHDFGLAADDRLYFSDTSPGQILTESDGTAAGTIDLFDLLPGYVPSCQGCRHQMPQQITPSGERVFFKTVSPETGSEALWAWQRGQSAPAELHHFHRQTTFLAAVPGGRVVFADFVPWAGVFSLWISDGTAAGTQPFAELPAGGDVDLFALAGQRLFFHLPAAGPVLWVTDFTEPGTRQLLVAAGMALTEMKAAGDGVFFAGQPSAADGRELGFSDGTPAGSRWLDLRPGPGASFPEGLFALADHRVVFAAAGDDAGNELWISDGTAGGSYRLTDLAPGAASSSPAFFAQVGNRLFFRATDGASGFELWALDLPPRDPAPPTRGPRRPRRR